MNVPAHIDSPQQRANWLHFEAGARAALAMVRSFGADQRMVTLALVTLLLNDLDDCDVAGSH